MNFVSPKALSDKIHGLIHTHTETQQTFSKFVLFIEGVWLLSGRKQKAFVFLSPLTEVEK